METLKLKQYHPIKTLLEFCDTNKLFVITTALLAAFIYWTKITHFNIGIDTNIYLDIGNDGAIGIGRYGIALLTDPNIFNKFFSIQGTCFIAVLFLFLLSLLYSNLFIQFNQKDSLKVGLGTYIFSFALISSPVWMEIIYFSFMSAACMFGVALCPIITAWMFNIIASYRNEDKTMNWLMLNLFLPTVCIALLISIYQPIFLFFTVGILICLFYHFENNEYTAKKAFLLCLIFLCILVVGFIFYILLGKIIKILAHESSSSYLTDSISHNPIKMLLGGGFYAYRLMFDKTPVLGSLLDPILTKVARSGADAVEAMKASSASFPSCFLCLPAIILLAVVTVKKAVKEKNWIPVIVVICSLIVTILLPMVGGGNAPVRSQFPVAIVEAFLLSYMVEHISFGENSEKVKKITFCIVILFCAIQSKKVSAIIDTDQLRYEKDVKLAYDLNEKIYEVEAESEYCEYGDIEKLKNVKLLFIGAYESDLGKNFTLKGEDIGHSVFSKYNSKAKTETTYYGTRFMQSLGLKYDSVNEDEECLSVLKAESDLMPVWPITGSVKACFDGRYVIIKLGATVHPEK